SRLRPRRARTAFRRSLRLPPRRQPQRVADARRSRRRGHRRRSQLVSRVSHNVSPVTPRHTALRRAARAAGAPLPVLIMHDVGWPYGRRDLYYAPDRVPEEFRQPYEQERRRLRTKKVRPTGVLNPLHYNAALEGGPRNGVMTALDDFVAEYDRPLRVLVLP